MAFEVETGSGSATANSLCSVATAAAYWADRRAPASWDGADTTARQKLLVEATDYIERRYRFSGTKKTATQALSVPRTGWAERDGPAIADTVVPTRLQHGVAYLAAMLAEGFEGKPIADRGGRIASESVSGAVATSYMDDAAREDALLYLDGLMFPFLSDSGVADTTARDRMRRGDPTAVTYESPEIPTEFASGAFDNLS